MPRKAKQPTLPVYVRIAGINHEVIVAPASTAFRPDSLGEISHEKATITLDANMQEWRRRKVFLHELIHAADANFGPHDLTEAQVETMENGLWAIFNDNPGLARALFGENA